jgi:hypothetical protein
VVSLRKVCEARLRLQKERSKLEDQKKWLKETCLGVGLVSNSSFLNEDVGITVLMILNLALSSSSIVLSHYIL